MSMGHWDAGKPAGQLLSVNLARKGFVVLAYDPVGQGERQQAYDPRMGRSLIGGATEQHFSNGAAAILMGQSVARYFIFDGMRGIDYLVSRPEVDPERIGATGCSGGGTQTTYIAALDPRVKVAAVNCYMNSFQTLFRVLPRRLRAEPPRVSRRRARPDRLRRAVRAQAVADHVNRERLLHAGRRAAGR